MSEMPKSLSNYDTWLERPYTRAADFAAQFERWCEIEGRDVEDEEAIEDFEEYLADMSEPDPDDARDAMWEEQFEERSEGPWDY